MARGEVAEWLKAHVSKACFRFTRNEGSNPSLSASKKIIDFNHNERKIKSTQFFENALKAFPTPPPHDYLKDFQGKTFVIKVSGKVFEDPDSLQKVIDDIRQLREAGIRCVLTYGGTSTLDRRIEPLGGKALHPDTGLRVTPARAIPLIKKERDSLGRKIKALFAARGIAVQVLPPQALQAERLPGHEETGRVVKVDRERLQRVLAADKMPVIGFTGEDQGKTLNINADAAAAAIAIAIEAEKLILLTHTNGVQIPNGSGDRKLSFADADRLLMLLRKRRADDTWVIDKGMLAKVKAALEAVLGGVQQVHIVYFRELLQEILTRTGVGTLIEKHQTHRIESASQKDLDAIQALHDESSEGASAKTPGGVPYLKPLSPRQHRALRPRTLVLNHRGVLIGKISWESVKGNPKAAYIGGFAVAEDRQGEQQGQFLMEEMLRRLKVEGRTVAVSITANPHVKKLYARLGGRATTSAPWQRQLLTHSRKRYGEEASLAELFVWDLNPRKA